MQDKDNWRWDDLETAFDEQFVANAQFKEAGWRERHKERDQLEAGATARGKRAKIRRISGKGPGEGSGPAASEPNPRSTLKRTAAILVVVMLLVLGLGLDGFGPFNFLRSEPPVVTTTTPPSSAPISTQAPSTASVSTPTQVPSSTGTGGQGSSEAPITSAPAGLPGVRGPR